MGKREKRKKESFGPVAANPDNLENNNPLAWEDQCEWHRTTRMTGLNCAVMRNLINTHTHTPEKNVEKKGLAQ